MKPIVIAKLKGGLGNQMFQYATARAVALKNKAELKFDITDTFVNPDRPYRLDTFAVEATMASPEEIQQFRRRWPLAKLFSRQNKQKNISYIKEKTTRFDPAVLKIKGSAYLDGYWQSEEYFKKIGDVIRKELAVKKTATGKNGSLLKLIQATESVCLHVRRGDYVTSKISNLSHGTCSPEYYQAAIKRLKKKLAQPHFFVFSDDLAWAKENLAIGDQSTFVGGNQAAPQEDLRLMSNCQHFITANSTFSWWAAWLSSNPKKIVIAPRQWFRSMHDDRDLIPKRWLRV